MSTRNIEALVNTDTDIELRYRCSCGYRGTRHSGRLPSDSTTVSIPPEV
jgi:hypothetical protein